MYMWDKTQRKVSTNPAGVQYQGSQQVMVPTLVKSPPFRKVHAIMINSESRITPIAPYHPLIRLRSN